MSATNNKDVERNSRFAGNAAAAKSATRRNLLQSQQSEQQDAVRQKRQATGRCSDRMSQEPLPSTARMPCIRERQTPKAAGNKTMLVLQHLKENGSITSWDAIQKYGATRLSAIIFNLRKHHDITTDMQDGVDRYGNSVRFAKYVYVGEIATDTDTDAEEAD